jgi:hypothetical protein
MGVGPLVEYPYVTGFPGYISWQLARDLSGAGVSSPHGGYSTTTHKCVVCHAPHRADADGIALTPVRREGTSQELIATGSCLFCHGPSATFSEQRIVAEHAGPYTFSPHGRCQYCHTDSPHGAGASQYPLFESKLMPDTIDAALDHDLADYSINHLRPEMFDLSDPTLIAQGIAVGTGYLCSACHDGEDDPTTHAVNRPNATPYSLKRGGPAPVTGHRTYAFATDTWNEDGEYGANYAGATDGPGDSRVAFRNATGCIKCHDAESAAGTVAFPHGYVDAAGMPVGSDPASGAAFLWLTQAADSDEAREVLAKSPSASSVELATRDGLCLRCHLSGAQDQGVGTSY